MIRTITEKYILSPILDHKEKYDLGGIEIYISKEFENNLRQRNCQLGVVEVLTPENPLKLSLGDIVFVNHFTFHGDIGADKSFTLNHHVEYEGKKLFTAEMRDIYFKYNDNKVEALPNFLIVEGSKSADKTDSGIFIEQTQYKDRGTIIYADDESMIGKEIYVENYALYPLDLRGEDLYRVNVNDVVGYMENSKFIPANGRVVLEDIEELTSSFLDLSMVKKPTTVKSKIIKKGICAKEYDNFNEGDIVLRGRGYGVKYNDHYVVSFDSENIFGKL